MYNLDLKNRFVASYDKKTIKNYLSDLKRISESEEYFKKDLFNFTYEQIDKALLGLQFKKLSSVERAVSTYRRYAAWANQNGFVPSKTNLWELFTGDTLSKYVWAYALENSYITREKLFEVIPQVVNPVDFLPIILVFEGIYGKTMDEVANLRYNDINFETGVVELTRDDGSNRTILIEDKRTLDIIKNAQFNKLYYKDNGKSKGIFAEARVILTPYVVRKTTTKNPEKYGDRNGDFFGNEKVGVMTIEARFARIFRGYRHPNPEKHKEPFIDGLSFLNATNIFKSGYFDYCLKMEQAEGELTVKHHEKACLRYGLKPVLAIPYKKQYLDWRSRLKKSESGDDK